MGLRFQYYFVTLSSVLSKALLTVENFSFRYLWHFSGYRVLFKEETVWVHPILKLSKISFTNALFQASFSELLWNFAVYLYISHRFHVLFEYWKSLSLCLSFYRVHHKFIALGVYYCWLARSLIQCLIACIGPLFNNLPQTIGLLGRGKHQEQARGTNVSLPAEENWSHSIIYFKTVQFRFYSNVSWMWVKSGPWSWGRCQAVMSRVWCSVKHGPAVALSCWLF